MTLNSCTVFYEKVSNFEELRCDVCNSINIKETMEGYVCGDCGIVLEIQKLQYNKPINPKILQSAVLNITHIGSKRERFVNHHSVKLGYMQKLQLIKAHEKEVLDRAISETNRILLVIIA